MYEWNSKWDERAESQKTRYIYLIRHGRYVANSSQGESLSPCGMRQAELTGIRICQCTTGRNVRKIVYSCMSRASQTAFTMARHLIVRLERSEDLIEGHPANELVSSIFQRLCDWSTDTCMYKLNYDLLYTG